MTLYNRRRIMDPGAECASNLRHDMQNIDFYERKNIRASAPRFADYGPEYLPRMAQNTPREIERVRKKASRTFFLISSLCIISFTAGIVIGIKFTGGPGKEIMDRNTFTAVTDFGKKFSGWLTENPARAAQKENPFPKQNYPYVIKVNDEYDYADSQNIAGFLSKKGHTVILTKYNDKFKIYIGPYRNSSDARDALKKISSLQKYSLAEKVRVIKR